MSRVFFPLRDIKTGREFFAEWSDIAGEWYEEGTGQAHNAGDVEIIDPEKKDNRGGRRPSNHGGPRPGAGRKALAPEDRRVPVCFSVSAEAKRRLQELRRMGVAVNDLVDDYIKVLHFDNTAPFADSE